MRIVFLDIDGVLVTRRSFFVRKGNLPTAGAGCVEALNHITAATGASIVVSSSWRREMTLDQLRSVLADWGVQAQIVDVTSDGLRNRGAQIEEWIARNGLVESFVILDDQADFDDCLLERAVMTTEEIGLGENEAQSAIEILLGKSVAAG
jgi:hypothetical protein